MQPSIVDILITAKDQASSVLQKTQGDLKKLGIAAVAASTAAALAATRASQEFDLQRGFIRNFGDEVEVNMNRLRDASQGAISDLDLMQTSNRAALLGVATNTEQLSQLMVTARLRGKEMGLSVTQAFNDIVTGIGRGSPLILDNLGIVIPDAIKKMSLEMDDAQRKELLLNFALADGARIAAEYGGDTRQASDAIESMKASVGNAASEIGSMLVPAMVQVSYWVTNAVSVVSGFIKNNIGLISVVVMVSAMIGGMTAALITISKVVTTVKLAFGVLTTAISALGVSMSIAEVLAGGLGIALTALAIAAGVSVKNAMDDAASSVGDISTTSGDAMDAIKGMDIDFTKFSSNAASGAKDAAQELRDFQDTISDLHDQIKKENEQFNEQLANLTDRKRESISQNKKMLADETESYRQALKDREKLFKEEQETAVSESEKRTAALQRILQREQEKGSRGDQSKIADLKSRLRNEGNLLDGKLQESKSKYEEETEKIKSEYEDRSVALKESIAEDQRALRENADIIKTINRDIIKDDITKLRENHKERLAELDKQIEKETQRYKKGSAGFKGELDKMQKDWKDFINSLRKTEPDLDRLTQKLVILSPGIGSEIRSRQEAVKKELERQTLLSDLAKGKVTSEDSRIPKSSSTGGKIGNLTVNINNANPNMDATEFVNNLKFNLKIGSGG